MAQTVIRAAQTNYETSFEGGTRDIDFDGRDVAPFMDAIENQDTPFLNSMKKGRPGNQRKERTGIHGVTPRGSSVSGAVLASATSLPVLPGHGVRFQQGHVIRVTAADGSYEHMWVSADPTGNALPVKRAQGGTTALAFEANDKVKIVGIAMPQLTDFPLAPVSRGRTFHNFYQEFSKHITMSSQARVSPNMEYPNGDWLDRDMLQVGKDIKQDLEMALINGRRQEGDPSPDGPVPSMLGGVFQFAELSGNVFNVGGAETNLTIEALEEALITMDEAVGSKAGSKLLMSIRTKQIFNRLLHPSRYQRGTDSQKVDLRWNSVVTEVGTYEFTHERNIPDGEIIIFDPKEMEYAPFQNLDWKEKEVPTKGNYVWKGMSGTYTFRPGLVPGYALLRNFNTNLADYPAFGTAA